MELLAAANTQGFMDALRLSDVYSLMLVCKCYYTSLKDSPYVKAKLERKQDRILRLRSVRSLFPISVPPLVNLTYLASFRLTFQFNFVARIVIPQLKSDDLLLIVYDESRQYPGECMNNVNLSLQQLVQSARMSKLVLTHCPHMGPDAGDILMRHMDLFPHNKRVLALVGPHDMGTCNVPYCSMGQESMLKPHHFLTNLFQYRSARASMSHFIPSPTSQHSVVIQKPTYDNADVSSVASMLYRFSYTTCSKETFVQRLSQMFDGDALFYKGNYGNPNLVRVRHVDEFV